MLIAVMRLIAALLVAPIAYALATLIAGYTLSIGHGYDTVSDFWAANDMNGMWYSGTLIVVMTRGLGGFMAGRAFVSVAPRWAGRYHLASCLVLVGLVGVLGWGAYLVNQAGVSWSPSLGLLYRTGLETLALLGGVYGGESAEDWS